MTDERIYDRDRMFQMPVYPTRQTPSYADWALYEMGRELEETVDENKLVAGDNITIEDGVISADVEGTTLVAGDNITIENGVISAVSGLWIPLTSEEYTDGSIFDAVTYELKKDLQVCLASVDGQRRIYHSSVYIPKGNKLNDGNYIMNFPNHNGIQMLGACYISLDLLFSQSTTVSVSCLRIDYTTSNGVLTISTDGSPVNATRGYPTGEPQQNSYYIEVYRSG